MHDRNKNFNVPIMSDVTEFVRGKSNTIRLNANQVEFKSGILPDNTTTMVFKPAL